MTEFAERLQKALLAAALLTAGVACKAEYPTAPDATLAAVRIHATSAVSELFPNSTATFVAYAIDSDGVYVDVTTRSQWSSSDPNVLTAGTIQNNRALVRGVGRGDANVTVVYNGHTDSVTLRVTTLPPRVPRVDLTIVGNLSAAATSSATVSVHYATPNSFQTVTSAATITSSDSSIARIDGARIRPVAPGTIRVTASYEGHVGATLISVHPSLTVQRP